MRIPPLLRGSVDFCSFGQVFSRALGVGHVGILMGTTLQSSFGESRLLNEVGASWVWWWDLWVCVGASHPQESLI
jgi:hypothetical protein